MNDNKLRKMTGYIVPFQNKGGGSYNLSLQTRVNTYTNDKYLGGILLTTDLGVDGMNIQRTCTITQVSNPQWSAIRDACISYFKDVEPVPSYLVNENTAVKVMFDFAGIEDKYVGPKYDDNNNMISGDKTYTNLVVENIELVENKSVVSDGFVTSEGGSI